MEGQALKRFVFLLAFLFPLVAAQAGSRDLYQWTDETGKVHIVDEINMVPESYRDTVRIFPVTPPPKKKPSIEKREVRESVPRVPEKQEQTEMSILAAEESAAEVELLRQRKAELEKDRTIARAQERRFRSSTVRSTVYKKRIQQIDEGLETIEEELDAIRQKRQ